MPTCLQVLTKRRKNGSEGDEGWGKAGKGMAVLHRQAGERSPQENGPGRRQEAEPGKGRSSFQSRPKKGERISVLYR